MIAPTYVGYGSKLFNDTVTWNGGGSNPYLTSYTVVFYPDSGYSFQVGDFALVATSSGVTTSNSGWSKILSSGSLDFWLKELTAGDTTFNSVWTEPYLWGKGIAGTVLRSPYKSASLYYPENRYNNSITKPVNDPSTINIPAVSRSSFEDSDFYYRLDIVYANRDYSGYDPIQWYWGSASSIGYTSKSYPPANTYEYISSAPQVIGMGLYPSSSLSGGTSSCYLVFGSGSTQVCNYQINTFWLRGWNPASSGVML